MYLFCPKFIHLIITWWMVVQFSSIVLFQFLSAFIKMLCFTLPSASPFAPHSKVVYFACELCGVNLASLISANVLALLVYWNNFKYNSGNYVVWANDMKGCVHYCAKCQQPFVHFGLLATCQLLSFPMSHRFFRSMPVYPAGSPITINNTSLLYTKLRKKSW